MKNKLNGLILGLLIVICNSLVFVSCSDDDADGGDSRIVGKWYSVHNKYTQSWYFKSNGTCNYGEWGKGDSEYYSKTTAKWNVDGNKLHVRWSYSDGDDDDYTFVYSVSDDGKTLTLSGGDGGKAGVYTKQ